MLYSSYDSCELYGKLGIICHHNHHTIICQNTDTKAVSSLRGYKLRPYDSCRGSEQRRLN